MSKKLSTRMKVKYATIYVFPGGPKAKTPRVSVAPERLSVRPGDFVDWTVVDATGDGGKVSIKWKKDDPLKEEAGDFVRDIRGQVRSKAKAGSYHYSVYINGVEVFDPELEVMN